MLYKLLSESFVPDPWHENMEGGIIRGTSRGGGSWALVDTWPKLSAGLIPTIIPNTKKSVTLKSPLVFTRENQGRESACQNRVKVYYISCRSSQREVSVFNHPL